MVGKTLLVILLMGAMAATLSGCSYVNNRNWADLTPEEREEVRQDFAKEREELEEELQGDSAEGRFVTYILDQVERAIGE